MLTLRKAGKGELEYLKITIEQGRVIVARHRRGRRERRLDADRSVSASRSTRSTVEYTPQGADGQAAGRHDVPGPMERQQLAAFVLHVSLEHTP